MESNTEIGEPVDDQQDPEPSRREALVRRTVKAWINELIDLGGRNNLLRYRDLRAGTLDLGDGDEATLNTLIKGRTIRLSRLFSDEKARTDAIRRARTIHRKAKENYEERGISTLHVACGIAVWTSKATWEPAAPVLLIAAELEPMGAALDDFQLTLTGEPELNQTLVHVLKVEFACDIALDASTDGSNGNAMNEPSHLVSAITSVEQQAERVPGFATQLRLVLGNFSFAKLPMVRDLQDAGDELVANDLIAAIAGDPEAREAARADVSATVPVTAEPPAADEFLILDADASQSYAINAVLAGQNLIVRGPPGTGKSQSIANLIGSLIARGRRVLFVAEKRAAIDAVLKRLEAQGLDELVLDLHGRIASRKAFGQAIGQALASARMAPSVNRAAEQHRLEQLREDLNRRAAALHEQRDPWGMSVYEAQVAIQEIGHDQPYRTRFHGTVLESLTKDRAQEMADRLGRYSALGGFDLATSASPWSNSEISTIGDAQQAADLLDRCRLTLLPDAVDRLAAATSETGLPEATTLEEANRAVRLWDHAAQVERLAAPTIYSIDLDSIGAAMRPARDAVWRLFASLFSGSYRQARGQVQQHAIASQTDRELHDLVGAARDVRNEWKPIGTGEPRTPADLDEVVQSVRALNEGIRQLATAANRSMQSATFNEMAQMLDRLADDRATLGKLPELHRLRDVFQVAGLGDLVDELEATENADAIAVDAFRWIWFRSILDRVTVSDPALNAVDGDGLDATVDEFQAEDQAQIDTAADRIRRLAAESATAARDDFPKQDELVIDQARRMRGHKPVRDVVHAASDVLLALKPCWAMSPLMVSQLLPARALFDVVVFDEASQVTPADAATSILRGRQLVVAGDEKQLPPMSFFAAEAAGETEEEFTDEDDLIVAMGTEGFESILDALSPMLRSQSLDWHYRSRCERLIAFSNSYIYDKRLTTFPGAAGGPCIGHVEAPWEPGADTNGPAPEVERVVDLVIEHATSHPDESLGVIAMGITHANKVDEALRARLRDHPELEEFFAEDREEPFFVKNLERVQGDERDAIILTIGYGKNAHGRLVYRFGPLLTAGGERRLNVAITRAKQRMTLVSSFSPTELDPERLTNEGMRLLRHYLVYAASGGTNLGAQAAEIPRLNAFEIDVRDALVAMGLDVVAQHGASGYRIDFAVRDPQDPSRFVMAIECDGASFHAAQSARDRDRLRQEHLERLGWRFHRIWSTEWFNSREAALAKVTAAYRSALAELDGEADEDQPATAADPTPPSDQMEAVERGPRPNVPRGWSIDEYWSHQLTEIVDWIESDDRLRSEDELLTDVMQELGFQRRGSRIVSVLRHAIRTARSGRTSATPTAARPAVRRRRPRPPLPPRSAVPQEPPAPPPPVVQVEPKPVEQDEPAEEVVTPAALEMPTFTAEPDIAEQDRDDEVPPEEEPEALPEEAAWAAQAAAIEAERAELEGRRKHIPAGEYVDRLHDLLLRRRALNDQRKKAGAQVVDGVVVTLEGPDGERTRSPITNSIVMRTNRDGWVDPQTAMRDGISLTSPMGRALRGARIGDTVDVDGLSYTVVDIDDH